MAPALLPSPPHPKPPLLHHNPSPARPLSRCAASRRDFTIHTAVAAASLSAAMSRVVAAAAEEAPPLSAPRPAPPSLNGGAASLLGGIANTRSWSQYYGSGFSIRVPPSFDDILEPEDFNAAMTYYGDKAKVRAYAARFASPDRSELVSVVIKPSNQLKITFLEAKDITELGTLKEASKLFVPGGAKIYSARTIKVKDQEDIRTYYFYEFRFDKQHVALMTTVDSGKEVENCGFVEWIDEEWPESLQYALHSLWSKVDQLTVLRLEEQLDHCVVSENLAEMEKKYSDLKAEVNKMVDDTVKKVQLANYYANLKEKDKDETKCEECDKARIEAEAKVAEMVEENNKLELEKKALKEENKKLEYALFDLLKAHHVNQDKLKSIKEILDGSNAK